MNKHRHNSRRGFAPRPLHAILATSILALSAPRLPAATFTWLDTNTGTFNWSAGLWSPVAPTALDSLISTDLIFLGSGVTSYTANNDLANPFLLNTLTLNSSATVTQTIGGSALSFNADDTAAAITQNGNGAFTIAAPVAATSALTLGGSGTGLVALNGVISGSGGLTFTGGNWQIGNAANSYTGGTTVGTGAFVEVVPSAAAPQSVNITPAATSILGSNSGTNVLTITGGTLKLSTKGNGTITFGGGRAITFGTNGGTLNLVNLNTPGVQGGNIAGGDLNITLANTPGNSAVIQWNGGQLGLSTNNAADGNWSLGVNALRISTLTGAATTPIRFELTNGALMRGSIATGAVDNNYAMPVTYRGVLGGEPTSGPSGLVNSGLSLTTGRVQTDSNRVIFNAGMTIEGAVQFNNANRTTAFNGNITVAGNGYAVFQGRSTGTNLSNALQAPGGTTNPGHNVMYLGENTSSTLTVKNGGIAVFDSRIRIEQNNAHGVLLGASAFLEAGATLRIQQSISNFSAMTGLNTTNNVGDIILRGNITGQGTTAAESVLTIAQPAPDAAGTIANGVPTPLAATAPAAGTRPFGGLVAEPAHNLVVNGSGFGGLRVTAVARPDQLFSNTGAVGGTPIPDPTPNTTKLNSYLTAARLAALTGSGGYLSPGAAGGTWTFPAGGEWNSGVSVGLRVTNVNTSGTDLLMGPTTWSHNLAVDAGATLDTGTSAFSLNGGTLFGTGTVIGSGGLTVASGATVSPGFSLGTLTVGNITLNGTLSIETTNAPATDLLAVSGNLTLGATSILSLPLTNTYDGSSYIIASYTGGLTGTFSSVSGLPLGYTVHYGTGSNSNIRLIFGAVASRVWNGNLSGVWDTATANWQGASIFANNDSATFDDTAAGPNFNVTIAAGGVSPSSTTVNNSATPYSITSSAGAALDGTGQLLKTGDGLLTLSGPATYSGGTVINGGELRLGASNSLPDVGGVTVGTGGTLNVQSFSDTVASLAVNGAVTGTGTLTTSSLTLGGGANLVVNLILNGNATKSGTAGATIGGTINLAAGTRTFDVAAGTSPELSLNGALGNGSLIKNGNGTLALNAANPGLSGTTTINAGTLRTGAAGALPPGGSVNVAAGTLDLNGIPLSLGNLTVNGLVIGGAPLVTGTLAGSGTINLGANLSFDSGTFSGVFTGAGTTVIKLTGGLATLSGTSTHDGGTVVAAGRLNASGNPGGTLGTTVNAGATLQFANTVNGTVRANGGTLSTATANNLVNGDLIINANSAVHTYNEDTLAASEAILTGTLRGTGSLAVSAAPAANNADSGAGFRLRGIGFSDYSGTITAGNVVKLELQSSVSGPFSPMGTGKIIMTAGTTNTPGSLQGTYSQFQPRTTVSGTTIYGNDLEITGSGAVNINVLGAANTTAVMGNLKLGGGQSVFFNKNDADTTRTVVFPTVTLTGGTATFSVYDRNFRDNANAFVGPNVELGAIGQSTAGAGVVFKAAAGDTATAAPIPHVTITGVSSYTGPTDIQTGPLTVGTSGSLASSSEIKLSGVNARLDVVPFGAGGYAIPAAQKLSGIGDWDGRIVLNGTLAPGNSIGTMTGDDFTFNGGAIMQFELSTLDNTSDRLTLSGAFTKGTAGAFLFDFEGGGLIGQTYTLVQFTSTDFLVSDFSYTDLGPGLSGSFLLNASDLQFVVVPEPGSAALLLGLGGLLARRRRG